MQAFHGIDGLFFVNVLAEDLMDPALYVPGAPLSQLARDVVLELTDRASLQNIRDVDERVARLRSLGYRIALDDWGAGQAGLDTFTRLEPEFVKLDLSVSRAVHRDNDRLRVVRSLTRICHDMGKAVIAEGVENSGERAALLDAGCDFMQGYFFGRPGSLHAAAHTRTVVERCDIFARGRTARARAVWKY